MARHQPPHLGEIRDRILEADRLYATSARQLFQRRSQGKITSHEQGNIHAWLIRAALRRAGLSLGDANRLITAS
jgi:hypothetical protein